VSEAGYLLGTDRYSAAVAWLLHGRSGVLTALASAPAPQLRAELARRAEADARHALAAGRGDPAAVMRALAATCRPPAPARGTGARVRAEIRRQRAVH
jgi:hypothetical protein